MEDWPFFLVPLALVGGGRRLGWFCLALAKEAAVAKLPENVEEKNAGDAEHDDALEKAVHRGDGAGDDNPGDARERDEAEQDGNQEHHRKQWTSSERQLSVMSSKFLVRPDRATESVLANW